MELNNLSVLQIVELIKSRQITCVELTKHYLNNIEKYKDKNAVLEVFEDCLTRAEEIDSLVASGAELPPLAGVPILIKDNILYKGKICSSASKILENYVAQYNATVIDRLLDAGVVILGRTNMDEFAMGGSCENSAFGPCKNAHNDNYVSGGSSGGSAVAVALDMCAFALGSDTGGSIRQPASYNGIVGIKPTYGRVSRYGLMAYAGSLDTVGVLGRSVKDCAKVLSIIAGKDDYDTSCENVPVYNYLSEIKGSITGKKIAIIKEVQALVEQTEYLGIFQKVLSFCKENGATITEVSIPNYEIVLPTYYTIAMAEASSNMGRFDGIQYTDRRGNDEDLESVYKNTRSQLLGREVKRRTMLGNYILSSEFYDAYYVKAKDIANDLKNKVSRILNENDLIFMPTTYGEAFEIGSKISDPLSMYIEDMFTVPINIVGVPAMSIPVGTGVNGLPIGLQIISSHFNEKEIFNMADYLLQEGNL
ncbi:MAG: Asp-tRNA(Asn)/Glu-tRNA(Gln) amidotransferase subunit GatA [Christensenellales bacterium]